jgi:hypothetical protein
MAAGNAERLARDAECAAREEAEARLRAQVEAL